MSPENITYSIMPEYDVCVFGSPGKGFTCYLCKFGDMMERAYTAESKQEMELHLKAHVNTGDVIPYDIFDRLSEDEALMYPGPRRDIGTEKE
jgi:hypothetical protein